MAIRLKSEMKTQDDPIHGLALTTKHRVVTYVRLILYAIQHKTSYNDLSSVMIITISPLLHFLRFKGRLPTSLGSVRIDNDDVLREFIYALFKTKFRYMPMLSSFARESSHLSTIVDVGANVGDFTLAVSRNAGRVISIEPGRETFVTLCANLRDNSVNNVTALNIAAHDSAETLSLDGHYLDLRVSDYQTQRHASGMPLDLVLSNQRIEHVDILKIDAQGHEAKVLKGATGSLKAHSVDLVIVEVHPGRGVKIDDIISLMRSFDYRLSGRDNGPFQPQLYFTNSHDSTFRIPQASVMTPDLS